MNKVMVFGRLVRDPKAETKDGKMKVRFDIADDKRYKRPGHPTANFFPCFASGKNAENIQKYFKQGKSILVTGTLDIDYVEINGTKTKTVVLFVDEWSFGGDKVSDDGMKEKTGNATTSNSSRQDDFIQIPEGFEEESPFF